MPRADSTARASSALVPGSSILAISVIKTATLAPSAFASIGEMLPPIGGIGDDLAVRQRHRDVVGDLLGAGRCTRRCC